MAWPDLPKQVQQSLKVLCRLAKANQPLKAEEVARLEEIPPAQAAKVLEHLTRAGFLQSRRGMKGGYWLEIPADRIRIGNVLASFGPRGRARRSKSDGVRKAVRKIIEPVRKAFEQLTIADISHFGPKELSTKKENADEIRLRAVK